MMKLFFKYMWKGVKESYKRNEDNLVMLLIFIFPIIVAEILWMSTGNEYISLTLGIVAGFVGYHFGMNYIRFKDARKYAKTFNVSFEVAWEKVK